MNYDLKKTETSENITPREAFFAGAKWILDEVQNLPGTGGFKRMLDFKLFPIVERYNQLKDLK